MTHNKLASSPSESVPLWTEDPDVEECAIVIDQAKARTAESIFEIGRSLNKAHDLLAHHGNGAFGKFVVDRCGFTPQTAGNYMRVVEVFGRKDLKSLFKTATLEAMYFVARESTPKPAIKEFLKLASKGEQITLPRAKEIVAKRSVDKAEGKSSGPEEALPDQPTDGDVLEGIAQEERDAQPSAQSSGPNENDAADPQSGDQSDPLAGFIEAVQLVVREWTDKCAEDERPKLARVLRDLADKIESGQMAPTTLQMRDAS